MVKENEQEFQMSSWQCFLVHDYTLVTLEIQLRLEDNLDYMKVIRIMKQRRYVILSKSRRRHDR
jgi:hypothetical protein